jgi:hypothetical protein
MSKATAVRGASVKRSTAAQRATAPQRSLVVRERRTTRRANDAMARDGTGIGIIAPRARTRARARMIARGIRWRKIVRERWRRGATRARARDARPGPVVDVGSGEDNADRIAASSGGRGRWRRASGGARARGGARELCGDRARDRGARRAARARAWARAGAGRSYPKRVLRARETDARRERLTVIRTLYDDS